MKSFKQFTQLTEISAEKTQKYLDRAMGDHDHQNMARRNTTGEAQKEYARKEALRKKGISRAVNRLYPQNESVEQIDEISKETANQYFWSARADRERTDQKITDALKKQEKQFSMRRHGNVGKLFDKSSKRTQGIQRALARMKNESVEQVDEMKSSTLQSYLAKRGNPEARKKTALDAMDHIFSKKPGQPKHQIHTAGMHRARQKIEKDRVKQTEMNPQKPRPQAPAKTGFRSGAIDDTYGT